MGLRLTPRPSVTAAITRQPSCGRRHLAAVTSPVATLAALPVPLARVALPLLADLSVALAVPLP